MNPINVFTGKISSLLRGTALLATLATINGFAIPTEKPESNSQSVETPFESKASLLIYQSPKISASESQEEVTRKMSKAENQSEFLKLKQNSVADRVARVKRLVNRGYAGQPDLEGAVLELQAVSDQVQSQEEFRELLDRIQITFDEATIVRPPMIEGVFLRPEHRPGFDVRLPGLSLAEGDMDFFTARFAATSATSGALLDYTEARLQQNLELPHGNFYGEYFENRLKKLSGLRWSRPSEINRAGFYVEHVKHLQFQANHDFESLWKEGLRNQRFDQFVALNEKFVPSKTRDYNESSSSFWLFGNGETEAASVSALSLPSIHIAQIKAGSRHEQIAAKSELDAKQRRYFRLVDLKERGYSNAAEVRLARLDVDLTSLKLKKAQAQADVSKMELEQVRSAISQPDGFPDMIGLPSEIDQESGAAQRWLTWLKTSPPTDAAEILRLLDLVEIRFHANGEVQAALRQIDHEKKRLSLYQKMPSVLDSELEVQQARLTAAEVAYAEAKQAHDENSFKLHQWAQRLHRQNSTNQNPTSQSMAKIIRDGKRVSSARAEVARIELARSRLKLIYDQDYLVRLREVHSRGAATNYELKKTRNQVQRSRGVILSSQRQLQIVEKQIAFLKVLQETGGLDYQKGEFSIKRFTPGAIEALEQLTVLMDGVDEGKIIQLEADQSDGIALRSLLKSLVAKGHASHLEVEKVNIDLKVVENKMAFERSRQNVLDKALLVVSSLQIQAPVIEEIPRDIEVQPEGIEIPTRHTKIQPQTTKLLPPPIK